MKKFVQTISLIAGLALFAYLIRQTGFATLADYLNMMGWGFALIITLSAQDDKIIKRLSNPKSKI